MVSTKTRMAAVSRLPRVSGSSTRRAASAGEQPREGAGSWKEGLRRAGPGADEEGGAARGERQLDGAGGLGGGAAEGAGGELEGGLEAGEAALDRGEGDAQEAH